MSAGSNCARGAIPLAGVVAGVLTGVVAGVTR